KGRYAVRVMVDIATSNKEYVSLSEIADRQSISVKYLERIVSKLTKAELLDSLKGSLGGYKLTKQPKDYSIAQILSVTGDLPELAPCQKLKAQCPNKKDCSTIGCWENLTKIIYDYLNSISLQDLINKTF
ncbi:MAG: Rrf2 family transcriptional regulator, partial [Clostridia bacterium]|nr:Rrf2 family transcriptional regulator [Clostridia bacterium]